MSTRGVYVFSDGTDSYSVYVHHDNYPTGAQDKLDQWFWDERGLRWEEPRFEADEAAAAFVCYAKTGPGGVRLTEGYHTHPDAEYVYFIYPSSKNSQIILEAWTAWDGKTQRKIYYGRLKDFTPEVAAKVEDELKGPTRYIFSNYEDAEAKAKDFKFHSLSYDGNTKVYVVEELDGPRW